MRLQTVATYRAYTRGVRHRRGNRRTDRRGDCRGDRRRDHRHDNRPLYSVYTTGDRCSDNRQSSLGCLIKQVFVATTIAVTVATCIHYTTGDRRRDCRSDRRDDDRL